MRLKKFLLSFKGKLTLLIIAAILLPLLTAALIARQVLQERLHRAFSAELEAGLGTITLLLRWIEQDVVTEIARIAGNDVVEEQLARGTVPELKKMLTAQRKVIDLALLAVFDVNHERVASSKFKSKNLAIDFNRLEQLQVVTSGEEHYVVYVLPITKNQRVLGYAAGGILLKDEGLLRTLHGVKLANAAFWLEGELLLTDLPQPENLSKPRAAPGELFEVNIAGQKHKGILREYPLGDKKMEYAWFISTRQLEEEEVKLTLALVAVVAVLFGICLTFLESILERMLKPLQHLAGYARHLSANQFSPRMDSALAHLAERSHDEVGKLADAFMHMERQLRAYIHELTETTRANERIQSELRIARDIQMSMLPHHGAWQHDERFAIAAALEPAREVGGDFYDYFMIDERHLAFAIGDVSGKGIPASLFMAVSKALVRAITSWARAFSDIGLLPQEILQRVNHELCRENDLLMFVTLFFGVLDTQTGEVTYSSAGHNPPFLLSKHPRHARLLPPVRGTPLGIKTSAQYFAHKLALQPGEALLLYTDGLIDARDETGDFYSEARLEKFLRQNAAPNVQELTQDLLAEIKNFARHAPAYDDLTFLALEYLPWPQMILALRNRFEDLQVALRQIETFCGRQQLAHEEIFSARLAVEEIITNTLKYGYDDDAEHEVVVALQMRENNLHIRIEDDARAFDPLQAPPSERGSLAGGNGLKLVRAFFEESRYQRVDGKNVFIAQKFCRRALQAQNV